jgi:hypothetical protein
VWQTNAASERCPAVTACSWRVRIYAEDQGLDMFRLVVCFNVTHPASSLDVGHDWFFWGDGARQPGREVELGAVLVIVA